MKALLKVGDWVEVRGKEEILTTLDRNGELDGMPFMPEMFAHCGKRFRVYKRAHKTCDTVFPTRGRRVERAVHLETRCDGSAHGRCEAECLIFWKEAWLKPVGGNAGYVRAAPERSASTARCAEGDVWRSAESPGSAGDGPTYHCQATRLPYATSHLDWWDIRQYIEDYQSGNVRLAQMFRALVYACYYSLSQAGIGLGPAMRWLYDACHRLWGGPKFPRKSGSIPDGQPTPAATLGLQPGELVRVKPHEEILATLTVGSKNRGLLWDAEMAPYCGGTYRVLKRVTRIVNENTGKMQEMKTPCVILDSVICQAKYSGCRTFCPRGIYPYWREIWLERVAPSHAAADGTVQHCSAIRRESSTSAGNALVALVALSHDRSAERTKAE